MRRRLLMRCCWISSLITVSSNFAALIIMDFKSLLHLEVMSLACSRRAMNS